MLDRELQSLPHGSIVERHTGEHLEIIVDRNGYKTAQCISGGSADHWHEGKVVPLSEVVARKVRLTSSGPSPSTLTEPMYNKITSIAKRVLDTKTKTLIKSGFMTKDLQLTNNGQEALNAIVVEEHLEKLVAAAQEVIDEESDN